MARGHKIETVSEVPLVIDSKAFAGAALAKTAAATGLLKAVGAGPELEKVKKSKTTRAGKGKLRGRRHRQRRGPLVVYDPDVDGKELVRGFRNIPGVETCEVQSLNLLQLAPGGHLGRFVVWTSAAFKQLDAVYESKKGFTLPTSVVSQVDVSRLINSSEVQGVLRTSGLSRSKRINVLKKNPLVNKQVMLRLNPYHKTFVKEKLGSQKVDDGKPKPVTEAFTVALHD